MKFTEQGNITVWFLNNSSKIQSALEKNVRVKEMRGTLIFCITNHSKFD